MRDYAWTILFDLNVAITYALGWPERESWASTLFLDAWWRVVFALGLGPEAESYFGGGESTDAP